MVRVEGANCVGAHAAKLIGVTVFSLLFLLPLIVSAQNDSADRTWKFAVSGDSRNCGDIVMPAIAASVIHDQAEFYWHLGDYRAIYTFDEDYKRANPNSVISDYFARAWPDFIQHQVKPFRSLPVYLAIGNHELISPMTRDAYIEQFADWLDKPELRKQRLADNPDDHVLKSYYHWIEHGVDFISMDNGSADQFDANQTTWFTNVLKSAGSNAEVKTVVLGMHASLPDGLSTGHSMNDSAQETVSGRQVYAQLLNFRNTTRKNVYVLASHSHFVLNNVYATACHASGDVLPGWIMGSAGAVRYRLPVDHAAATVAMTDVYGYLLGTVAPDGTISFEFKQVQQADVPDSVVKEFTADQVSWCFTQNKSPFTPAGATCPVPH